MYKVLIIESDEHTGSFMKLMLETEFNKSDALHAVFLATNLASAFYQIMAAHGTLDLISVGFSFPHDSCSPKPVKSGDQFITELEALGHTGNVILYSNNARCSESTLLVGGKPVYVMKNGYSTPEWLYQSIKMLTKSSSV